MKKLKVLDQCNGCGICVVNSKYFEENNEGNAEAIKGLVLKDEDIEFIIKVIEDCPQGAITIIETNTSNKKGTERLKELSEEIEKKLDGFNVPRVQADDIQFDCKSYDISGSSFGNSSKSGDRIFDSKSHAKTVAKSEFERLCYSPYAYRPVLKQLFVEYKVKVLKPYYTCHDGDISIYFHYNLEIESFLKDIYAEACEIYDGHIDLEKSWCEFRVYPVLCNNAVELLSEFEERSTSSGIIDELKSRGEYTSLNWYIDMMEFDYDEMYEGEGLFGRMIYKNKWYFQGFYNAVEEFAKDLKDAVNYKKDDITADAVSLVNLALEYYEQRVKEELEKKLWEFNRILLK